MASIRVRCGPDEIKANQVCLWEQDAAHFEVDEKWREMGGAFLAGNSQNPEAEYLVADTPEVIKAIKAGRLIRVEESAQPSPPTDQQLATSTSDVPTGQSTVTPTETQASGEQPAPTETTEPDIQPPAADATDGEQPETAQDIQSTDVPLDEGKPPAEPPKKGRSR